MNQNKLKKEENKKTLWSQSNKTYVRDRQANSVDPTLSRHRLITAYKINPKLGSLTQSNAF